MRPTVMLGWPDRALEATGSGGSWEATYPGSAMTDERVTEVSRSTDLLLASTKRSFDLGAARTLRMVAAVNHNAPHDATWRIRAGSSAGLHDLYDSDWVACHAITYGEDGIEWLAPNWWGDGVDTGVYGCPYNLLHVLSEDVVARYWSVEWDATTSAESYLQVGRLVMCPTYQPEYNAVYGITRGMVDASAKTRLATGGFVAQPGRTARTVQMSLPATGVGAEEYRIREMMRRQRTVSDVYYVPNPGLPERSQVYGFLGTMTELTGMKRVAYGLNSVDVQLTERL